MILGIFLWLSYVTQCSSTPDKRVITSLKYVSRFRVKPTVVNGEPAKISQLPFLVSIKEPIKKKASTIVWANLCGGTILSDNKILTAAHCFEADNFFYLKRPYILRVIAGNIHTNLEHSGISGASKAGAQWRRVMGLNLHSNFHFPINDIALVYVDYPLDFTSVIVRPIELVSEASDYLGSCMTAGYGRVGHGVADGTSSVLLLAPVDTLSRRQCSLLWEVNMDKFVCSVSARSDVSEGDSGGPLWCARAGDRAAPRLAGLVSGKNFDTTTIFTRVSAYRDWIDSDGLKSEGNTLFYLRYRLMVLYFYLYLVL